MTDHNQAADQRFVLDPVYDEEHSREIPGLVRAPQAGDPCPVCREGKLDYDGLLNLVCPVCGFSLAGCFT